MVQQNKNDRDTAQAVKRRNEAGVGPIVHLAP
jgi:hypothetical protein